MKGKGYDEYMLSHYLNMNLKELGLDIVEKEGDIIIVEPNPGPDGPDYHELTTMTSLRSVREAYLWVEGYRHGVLEDYQTPEAKEFARQHKEYYDERRQNLEEVILENKRSYEEVLQENHSLGEGYD